MLRRAWAGQGSPVLAKMEEYSLKVSGLDISYPALAGAHPLTGRHAEDVRLASGGPSRLIEAMRGGKFVLLAPEELHPSAKRDHVLAAVPVDEGPVRLVRPDGFIGWAADSPSAAEVEAALASW